MNQGLCPKCGAPVVSVKAEVIVCDQPVGGKPLEGVSLLCPSCNAVLGVHMDHPSLQEEALKTD